MNRLVVVSNRIGDPRKPAAGGLAVALGESLAASGGLWFGWSGKVIEAAQGGRAGEGQVRTQHAGPVRSARGVACARHTRQCAFAGSTRTSGRADYSTVDSRRPPVNCKGRKRMGQPR